MPLYEYQCAVCGHEDTLLEKLTASRTKKCPSCGKARSFKRLVSAAGFQLKGQGWYQTDFRNAGKPPAPAKDQDRDAAKDSKKKEPAEAGKAKQQQAEKATPKESAQAS